MKNPTIPKSFSDDISDKDIEMGTNIVTFRSWDALKPLLELEAKGKIKGIVADKDGIKLVLERYA